MPFTNVSPSAFNLRLLLRSVFTTIHCMEKSGLLTAALQKRTLRLSVRRVLVMREQGYFSASTTFSIIVAIVCSCWAV